jgi:hypothetical protein
LSTGTISILANTTNAGNSYRGVFVKQLAFGLLYYTNVLIIYDWFGAQQRSTGINCADGKCHAIALTFHSGVTNGTVIYLDGEPVLTTTFTVQNQTMPLMIGFGNSTAQYYFGLLEDARIYNRALTPGEVWAIYANPWDLRYVPEHRALPGAAAVTGGPWPWFTDYLDSGVDAGTYA